MTSGSPLPFSQPEPSIYVAPYAAVFAAGITLALVLLSLHQRKLGWTPFYAALLLFHPAWTMGIERMDHGYSTQFFSVAVSLVLVAILVCQVLLPNVSKGAFLFGICLICWSAYFIGRVLLLFSLFGMPERYAGFVGESLFSLVEATPDLLVASLVLSLLCTVYWLWCQFGFRRRSAVDRGSPQMSVDPSDARSARSRSLVIIEVVLLVTFLLFAGGLLRETFVFHRIHGNDSIIALIWVAILTVAAARRRLPGWKSA